MARKKKLNIRVFKLRSGEELVAEIVGKVRGKITINRPMKIITSLAVDPYTGAKRNVTYLHSWLGSSSDIKANLPIDFIVMDLPPDADVIVLYEKQMNMDDAATNSSPPPPAIPDAEMKKLSEGIYKDLEKLMKECDIPFPKREKTPESSPLVPYQFGYAENVEEMIDRSRYDFYYLQNNSLYFDVKVVLGTLGVILTGK